MNNTDTPTRVLIAIIFGAAAILLAYIVGRIDASHGGFSVSWTSIAICLILIIVAPIIAESNIKHREKQRSEDHEALIAEHNA